MEHALQNAVGANSGQIDSAAESKLRCGLLPLLPGREAGQNKNHPFVVNHGKSSRKLDGSKWAVMQGSSVTNLL
jgi:hypothetical protein